MRYAILLLLLAGIAFAEVQPSGNPTCRTIDHGNGNITIDYNDPNCQNTLEYRNWKCTRSDIVSFLSMGTGAIGCFLDQGLFTAFGFLVDGFKWLVNVALSLITYSPDISRLKPRYDSMMKVAQSVFSVLIAALGIYWIAGAKDIEGRIKAKAWSERLFTLILLEAVGFFLFKMALGLNNYIAGQAIATIGGDLFSFGNATASASVMLIVALAAGAAAALTVLTLVVRIVLIAILLVFFPFTMLLYMTPATRKWGSVALNLTMAVIFLGALDTIVLYSASAAGDLTNLLGIDVIIKPLIACVTFGLVGTLNIYVILMVPGLSGGVSATKIIHSVATGTTSSLTSRQGDPAAGWGK